jgi:hypothetical protein
MTDKTGEKQKIFKNIFGNIDNRHPLARYLPSTIKGDEIMTNQQNQGQNNPGNFANDRKKASEAGQKGGQNSQGGRSRE